MSYHLRKRSAHRTHDWTLALGGGLVAGLIFMAQMDLTEVLRVDRFQHVIVSMALLFAFYFFGNLRGRNILWALLAVFSIGLFKEFIDPQSQGLDMVANSFGMVLGLLFLAAIQITVPRHRSFQKYK